jgi:hypothetical protein
VDDDLRELERAVSAQGDAGSRIRLARALQRAGRRDEVASVLRPAVADAEVRNMLLGLPAWTHWRANPGRTCVLDVAPVRREPEVRVLREARNEFVLDFGLLASEVVLLIHQTRPAERAIVLDAVDARERFDVATPAEAEVFMEGGFVMAGESWRDVWTGAPVGRSDGLRAQRAWVGFHCSESWVLAWTEDEILALDRDGHERWRAPRDGREFLSIDENGYLASPANSPPWTGVEYFDRDGEFVWAVREKFFFSALGATWVLGSVESGRRDERTLAVFHREDGTRRATFPVRLGRWGDFSLAAVAREVVYFTVPHANALVAANLHGDELWRVTLGPIAAIAPASGCLYAVERSGTLYRLS